MKNQYMKIIKEWVIPLLISFTVVFFVKQFLYEPFKVHGLSMYPTLQGEEFIFVNKWKYRVDQPRIGDIIVFHTGEHKDFIKRVIGLPGDRILIVNGSVYRNGKQLDEPYLKQPTYAAPHEVTVGSDEIYVLGDNRANSKDSRMIGPVKQKEVVGRADVVVFPFNEMRALYS